MTGCCEREPGIYERARWDATTQSLELTVRRGDAGGRDGTAWATPSEWRRLLTDAGFGEVTRYGWFDRRAPADDDSDSVWIAR